MQDSLIFAASGNSTTGQSLTGLYVSLSCAGQLDTIPFLSSFGDFTTVYASSNDAKIVASGPAIAGLSDSDLSNWGYSVHEAFLSYPTEGRSAFQALAVLGDYTGTGVRNFANGISGLPYIITRGATPAGCGNGEWEASIGEECDDGNSENGDGCSASCKCESGLPNGDGTCEHGCGDGKFNADLGEQCDDGNVLSGDGCSSQCLCELPLLPDGAGKCISNSTVPQSPTGSVIPVPTGSSNMTVPDDNGTASNTTVASRTDYTITSTAVPTGTGSSSINDITAGPFTNATAPFTTSLTASTPPAPVISPSISTFLAPVIDGTTTMVVLSNTTPRHSRRPTATILPTMVGDPNGAAPVSTNSTSSGEGSGIIIGVNVVVIVDCVIETYQFGDRYGKSFLFPSPPR